MDITVEDPSPEFQTLRDFVDCQNILALGLGMGVVGRGLGGEEEGEEEEGEGEEGEEEEGEGEEGEEEEGEGEEGRCDVLRTKLKLSRVSIG